MFGYENYKHGRFQQIQMYPNTLKIHMVCVTYIHYKIDHFDYSCDKFMKFEFFYEK
jgi:hypothetical protein